MSTRTAPASRPQAGLWFLDRWNPGSATYNTPCALEFDHPVVPQLLQRALERIVHRHEVLRTTFVLGPDGPLQLIHDTVRVPLVLRTLPESPPAERSAVLEEILAAEAATPFDLSQGPLIRATLVGRTTLLVMTHHIVWDGWSASIFEHELAELYSAFEAGREPDLPPLTEQYADYASAETRLDHAEHRDYWSTALAGVPTELDLPTDRPRPALQTHHGGTRGFAVPAGTAERLRDLAGQEDATAFVVQLAAFAVLLGRYSGARDLVIGTPVTTRARPELEDLIGYFVNLLPLRVRLDPRATFRDLVAQVRDTAFDAYAYCDLPFDGIVDTLGLERSARRAPLVQVVFGAHGEDRAPLRFGSSRATRRTVANATSKFDITWSTFDDGELRGEIEYNTDLFDTATAERLVADWLDVLRRALDAPDSQLWRLTPGAAEPVRPRPLPTVPTRCLHQGFEDAADRFPDRPALSFAGATLTYAELDARANRLAHALIGAGVRPGDRVGLLLDRTPHVVEAILAVLKAGAAYVPVDLTAPADRAAFVFGDTGVRVVVTDQGEAAPAGPWRCFDLAEQAAHVAVSPSVRPGVPVAPGAVAYLIFTSGSTGAPKGVAVAHEHVSRLMSSGLEHFGFTEDDVWTLFHSYAFDWTVWELWGALHHGGRLVVVPYLTSRDPGAFADLLAAEDVSRLCLTPSALRQLEQTLRAEPRPLPALRQVMLGGEALDPAVVRRWFQLPEGSRAPLCNLYGITETTVHVTTHDLAGADGFDRSLIGGAMPHLDALVLDEWLRPCPVGVPGELYIAGAALAYGYWGRSGLTAQRFIPDPTGTLPGGRLYRTGDVARRLADGGLEYLGRCDHQVKIRGFRIELGEIENALTAHPAVRTAVVTVAGEDPDDRRLAAYITVDGPAPGHAELRRALSGTLPDYMIPATVTVLDVLPVTPNGKVDRAALPAPQPSATGSAGAAGSGGGAAGEPLAEPPATPAERLLAEVWTEVLGIPGIGRRDDFFHLGGDSIRAVRLSGRLREHGWTLSLPDLFSAPALADLATLLRPADADADPAPATVPFALVSEDDRESLPTDVVDAYPMVSMQLAMIFHMELSGGVGGYHNVNSYRVGGRLDESALRQAIADVMARHPVLRTSLDVFSYSEPLQLVHAEAPVPLQTSDIRALTESGRQDAVTRVFDELCDARFDLRTAPLFRVVAQRLAAEEFQLTLAEHHAILDGWSFTSMLTEILERHAALRLDPDAPRAPSPAVAFRDFVAAEKAAERSPDSAAFWRDRLEGVSAVLFPGAGPRSTDAEIPRTVEHVIPDADRVLRGAAAAAGTPVKAVALAAHVLALTEITGQARITTGLSVNGRIERDGGTECYGLHLNTVPLTVDVDLAGSGPALVRHVHRAETELLAHRRMPFARLARLMADTRLDANFAFLRFHSLGRLAGDADGTGAGRIVDDRIGCEPTLRYEPTDFALGVALVQDPSSGRALLAVDHLRSQVPEADADRYAAAYLAALAALSEPHPEPAAAR
ncbi:amino acid adenylation domain-containing protein [Catenulispora sp. GAS73]|uniref:amino acid adenylation domain-containing protein n=1 Tax=Catenulispora sp. GAS73 TaxID=3156269 RepID=UPI0035128ED6